MQDRSEKRQLIRLRIIIVFNYSGIFLLGKTSEILFFTLPVSITGAENGETVYQ